MTRPAKALTKIVIINMGHAPGCPTIEHYDQFAILGKHLEIGQ
jgi:hypothetical protein